MTFTDSARIILLLINGNNIFLEIDFILEDGSKAMLVEVKVKPTIPDVKEHIKRLNKMRAYSDLRGDTRAFLGAVAGY